MHRHDWALPASIASILATVFVLNAAPGYSQETTTEEAETPFVLPQSGPFNPEDIEIKSNDAIMDWYRSAHADDAAEAFRHWDEDEEIRAVCATCHSGEGFRSFHGLDGSEPGVREEGFEIGGVVDCGTCHNEGLGQVTEVQFPSGLMHPVVGVEAACMTCHQGRTAGNTVEAAIEGLPVDEASGELRFINPHYATAAASWLGGYGGAGYHYADRDYAGRFFHSRPVETCVSCHDPHRLDVDFQACSTCHEEDTPEAIRISRQSYDGSGDTEKGIRDDIHANSDLLMEMVRRYATDVNGVPILYDGGRYPYFFADANGDGAADQTEDGGAVAYNAWTPRMLRTAYNWKLVTSDPGNFVHNPEYALQLLHDSIEDLAGPLGVNMDDLGLLR